METPPGIERGLPTFEYGAAEIDYLKRRDKKLGAAIDRLGMIRRKVMPEPFPALAKSIVGQQVSSKAMETVYGRLDQALSGVTPASVAGADVEAIQKCGLSMRKARYIKGVGEAVFRGDIDFSRFGEMSDEDVIARLASLPGVGVWTAEMLLIHSFHRPDVVSWGDLAIRRGMMRLYGLKTLSREQFERYRRRYSPHGSVASLYLWALSVE
ncbi:DNA-3-methyladenine glycosylase family protein [Fundidesulfovibrio terrae]|uniref:DNA-3-methyladenine glycosylase family protein n=1 Tax=Fundidesulfovibrio terrae TaxID=2922866 RepID=UPI001FAE7E8F